MGNHSRNDRAGALAALALFGALAPRASATTEAPAATPGAIPAAVPSSPPARAGTATGSSGEITPRLPTPDSPVLHGASALRDLIWRGVRQIVPAVVPGPSQDVGVMRAGLNTTPTSAATPAALPVRPTTGSVKAVATVDGVAAPGLRILLSGRASQGEGLRYLWVQTRGPDVKLEKADSAEVGFVVPGDATELAFQLVVAGPAGVDRTLVEVPLQLHAKPVLPALVTADAGDDQMAVVGHRVTLNGARCRPREQLAYRWIYVSGPPIRDRSEEAWICSFVPTAPGLHRFLLVVATDGVISKPDEVIVSVVADADAPRELRASSSPRPNGGDATGSTAGDGPVEALARRLLTAIEPDGRHARDLAGAFDSVAQRVALYETYGDLFSEISRRVDVILPSDTTRRGAWDRDVFEPLSDRIVASLKPLDLDPSRDVDRPLNTDQRRRLASLFQSIGDGFRAAAPALPATAAAPAPAAEADGG